MTSRENATSQPPFRRYLQETDQNVKTKFLGFIENMNVWSFRFFAASKRKLLIFFISTPSRKKLKWMSYTNKKSENLKLIVVVWVIVRVCSVVLRRTVVGVDCRFDNLRGSHHQSSMMASARVVETSVNTNNSPSQDHTTNPDDHSNHNIDSPGSNLSLLS